MTMDEAIKKAGEMAIMSAGVLGEYLDPASFRRALAEAGYEVNPIGENAAMREQIVASQMRRLRIGDELQANQSPHRCPICEGRGQVLFNPDMPYGDGTSCGPWQCRPCGGTGIVWTVWQTAENAASQA